MAAEPGNAPAASANRLDQPDLARRPYARHG
jgi:hypothetical protein